MSYERDRREIIEEYFEKRRQDQIKEEIMRHVLTYDALEKARFIKVSNVFLYDKLRDTIVNLYKMGRLSRDSIDIPKLKQIVREIREYMKMEERKRWGRKVA